MASTRGAGDPPVKLRAMAVGLRGVQPLRSGSAALRT